MSQPAIFVFTTAYRPLIGGAEVAIEETIARLKDRYRFVIFTARMSRDLPAAEKDGETLIVRLGIGMPRIDKLVLPFAAFAYGLIYMRRYRPRLLWGIMVSYASIGAFFLKLVRPSLAFALTLQEGNWEWEPRWRTLGLSAIWWPVIFSRADKLVAISNFLLETARGKGFRGEGRVIPNGVDEREFKPASANQKGSIRKSFGVPPDAFIVFTASRLVKKNGVDVLIDAFAKLDPAIQEKSWLWIAGLGELESELKSRTAKLGIQTRVVFFGAKNRHELAELYRASDVFVRPSRAEGMGNVFIEALACGIPIVGTPVGGIRDIIVDGETGIYAKVDDPLSVARAVEKLITDRNLAERIAANGRAMALARFTWGRVARDYGELFENLSRTRLVIAAGLYPPEIGGPATYSQTLAENLPAYGIVPDVAPFRDVRRYPKLIRHLAYGWKIFRRARMADAVFAQDPVSVGLPAMLAAKLARRKFIVKITGDYAWEQGVQRFGVMQLLDDFLLARQRLPVRIFQAIERFVANRADRIITPSLYLKSVVERWGVDSKKIAMIYNAVRLPDLDSREILRSRFGLSGRIIVSAGRFVPWKGFSALIEIFPRLRADIPDLSMRIIGSGPDEARLKSMIADRGLENSVRLIGPMNHTEFLAYLKAADLFVLNTGYEGLPHAVLEALLAGTPVITTDAGGNSEVVRDGENGRLVRYNDREALTRSIIQAFSQKGQKKISLKRLANEFSQEAMMEKTMVLIKEIVAREYVA